VTTSFRNDARCLCAEERREQKKEKEEERKEARKVGMCERWVV
tara:strand:+ start:303 stop:431 length:129 start_codon:yes stop_codon:yes gene_type:complete